MKKREWGVGADGAVQGFVSFNAGSISTRGFEIRQEGGEVLRGNAVQQSLGHDRRLAFVAFFNRALLDFGGDAGDIANADGVAAFADDEALDFLSALELEELRLE